MWVTKHFLVLIDFHSIFFLHTMEINGGQQLFGSHVLQNVLFCVQQKKETLKGLGE